MFKVIIAGSREYSDYAVLAQRCDFLLSEISDPIEIVSGTARGADSLGERYASERGLQCTRFPADWDNLGRSAGPVRNIQMAEYADALIAFPIGKSVGTRHMISAARKRGLRIKYGTNPSTPKI